MKELFSFLDNIPKNLREGPWSKVAVIYFTIVLVYLTYVFGDATKSFHTTINDEVLRTEEESTLFSFMKLLGSLWCFFILSSILYGTGFWPLVSYTITSWNFLSLRLLFSFLTKYVVNKAAKRSLAICARLFKFPALVGCVITVSVWWCILVPVIHYNLEKKYRNGFMSFNLSFILLNIHLFNLPLAVFEFVYSQSSFEFFDLWIGLVVAFMYVMFYLLVLDPKGIHLYIVLTPRTRYCFIVFSAILGLYYIIFNVMNSLIIS